ncbi:MAG: hypothetical protein WKG01_14985 [Kofleriaceae bacterium]
MMRVVVCVVLAIAGSAAAQPGPGGVVALLPLDAEARLEIYGQPVASEIARALTAGGIVVVVIGAKMAVPERAQLIVDGTIKNKGDAVVLSIRIRNTDGTVVKPLAATAPTLAAIDRAATDLSARALPIVRDRLAELKRGQPVVVIEKPAPATAQNIPLLVAIAARGPDVEPLRGALGTAIDPWVRARKREPRSIDAAQLAAKLAANTVAQSGVDRGLVLEVLDYRVEPGEVPLARARVQVRIADAGSVLFDRIVATDTIVGDRNMAPDALAARVAGELLSILRPHLRREVPGWR